MRWRELIISGVVTLVVTVVAGIIVWFVTRAPNPRIEDLKYSSEYVPLSVSPPEEGVGTVKIGNVGSRAARNVRVVIEIPSGIGVKEQRIQFSSGEAATYQKMPSAENTLNILAPLLAPEEFLTVTSLITGTSKFEPTISVKSDESIGQPGAVVRLEPSVGARGGVFFLVLVCALVAQMVLLLFLRNRLQNLAIVQNWGLGHSVNNTAFIYLQKKQIDEAERMLSERIRSRGGSLYYLANHGLALGLQGRLDAAEARLSAADWLAAKARNREKALIKYNRATLQFALGDLKTGKALLAEAIKLHASSIRRYCELSDYISEAILADATIRKVIESSDAADGAAR